VMSLSKGSSFSVPWTSACLLSEFLSVMGPIRPHVHGLFLLLRVH
jgi:hypothetical protein